MLTGLLARCDRVMPAAVLVDTTAFVALILLAMSVYPGGTAWDPTTHGHDFWLNYLCDLERSTALDGRANGEGAALAQAALLVLGVGCMAFWRTLPALYPARVHVGRATRWLGLMSACGLIAVAVLPPDRFPSLHPLLMIVAGGPGILAAALGVVGLATGRAWPILATVGAAVVVASGVDLVLYLRQLCVAAPAPVAVAVLERVALLLALAWRALVAVEIAVVGRVT